MRLPVGMKDARVALALVAGMLIAGFVLPLASPERSLSTTGGFELGAPGGTQQTGSASAPLDGSSPTGSTGPGAPTPSGGADAATTGIGSTAGAAGSGGNAPDGGGGSDAGTQPSTRPQDPGSGADQGGVARTASDQGITPETIKIGVALANLDAVSRTGVGASNGTVAERRQVWEAILARVNEAGGAAGRTVEAAYEEYDALNPNASLATCRKIAEDHKPFVAFADVGWQADDSLCFTRQYGIPNIVYDAQEAPTYEQAGGLLFTSLANIDRILYDELHVLHERGLLRGKKIGLVTSEGYGVHDRTQIPTLKSLGYELTHRSNLSNDVSTAQSQIPVEIQQMRSKGVDFILWSGGPLYSNTWVPQAQRGGYNPIYSMTDHGSGSDDFTVQAIDRQMDAYAWGARRKADRRTDRPPAESDAACVADVRRRTGLSADKMSRERDLYWETARYCGHVSAFVDAANAAGPNPTRQAFAAAMFNLGKRTDLDVGPAGRGGSWSPGKPDGPDFVQPLRHDLSCRCWRPEGDWIPMRQLGG